MLDTDTKRRIDSCRDILVGKVPDPKSQVEQITIALIYKFMDDMDAQSEEFGGKRSFFVNGFEKYSWSKLLAPSMGGQDTLNLYSEAIGKMTENTHLPALFRDIFKNAYLPYRDPETLKAFLKEIDGFSYDHSERLGDAFEYLLSVLGSQGDAGQFRTPRHIIDFIVRVINPQKHERILDPACGTAGFLISAWKYILDQNKEHKPGDKLTPDERNKLAANIHGYDISPDMVRLSLVNLYLHGFTNPHVDEYDTLTSEDKWNEHADVILANPPFMSPKGGIKPHKRFSIQATRSEVLFVDYIHEHLSPNGRAGIIVPEGIVFQSGTAYRSLRQLLVKNSLVAVISLPAGVFLPYSGVKTSILILDKKLAKKTNFVIFTQIESDGFALNAQRRQTEQNDLPCAEFDLLNFFSNPNGQLATKFSRTVSREVILASDDTTLHGDRFIKNEKSDGMYPYVPLSELCSYIRGVTYKKTDEVSEGGVPVLRANNIDLKTSKLDLSDIKLVSPTEDFNQSQRLMAGDILICAASGSADHVGKVAFSNADTNYFFGGFMAALRANEKIIPQYLFECLKTPHFRAHLAKMIAGANINNLKASIVHSFEIPLPPIEKQREIVDEINGKLELIDSLHKKIEEAEQHIKATIDRSWAK